MELRREGGQRIGRVLRQRVRAALRHLPGACMTAPQTVQVRCAALE
jgi:hypothetical protein